MAKQSGFAVVETLLVVVLLGIIGFTGWYVWHTKQLTDSTLKTGLSSSVTTQITEKSVTDPIASKWFKYTTPSNEYSIRLADGWKLNLCKGSADLYTYGNANVHYQPGLAAKVEEVECGSDGGADGMFITYFAKPSDVVGKAQGEANGEVLTVQAVHMTRYIYTEATEQEGIGAVDKGGKIYSYIGTKNGHTVLIAYGVLSTSPDEHETVEKSIATFQFLK